jgi:hypothetical protein
MGRILVLMANLNLASIVSSRQLHNSGLCISLLVNLLLVVPGVLVGGLDLDGEGSRVDSEL